MTPSNNRNNAVYKARSAVAGSARTVSRGPSCPQGARARDKGLDFLEGHARYSGGGDRNRVRHVARMFEDCAAGNANVNVSVSVKQLCGLWRSPSSWTSTTSSAAVAGAARR
eukprot:4123439-Pyramimonas_sp.AAC.1